MRIGDDGGCGLVIALILISVLSKYIDCQVVLTRQLLEDLYGDELFDLNTIYMTNSGIASIDPDAFNGLTNLESIDLDYNQLTTIDPKTFNGLANLIELYLHHNQLTKIAPYTFNSLKSLVSLFINNNRIVSFPSTIFLGLTNLEKVYLYSNPIYDIYGQAYLQSLCDPNPRCIVYGDKPTTTR